MHVAVRRGPMQVGTPDPAVGQRRLHGVTQGSAGTFGTLGHCSAHPHFGVDQQSGFVPFASFDRGEPVDHALPGQRRIRRREQGRHIGGHARRE